MTHALDHSDDCTANGMKKRQYDSVFPLLAPPSTPASIDPAADASKVAKRLAWLVKASKAPHLTFALRLRHEEPEASFYPTLYAVQATNDDNAIQCWLRLEQGVCARKLVALQAHLRAVCSEYSIELTTEKKAYHYKFPHQRKALKVVKDDICTALAEHAFPLLDPDDEDDGPIEGNIGVAAWIARARAVQDADDEREKTPQEHDPAVHDKNKRGRSEK